MSDNLAIQQVLAQMRAMKVEAAPSESSAADNKVDFGDLLKNSIDQVNATQHKAKDMATNFELGVGDANLAQVMIAGQKSSLSFQAMVQVRNKLVEAYKDIMSMPV
jgi:flagellar hook-basal body complex protein FliE